MRLLFALALVSTAASAQSSANILSQNAGYETGQQLREQDTAFSFDRFRAGFERGLRGDSVEIAYALGLRAGLGLREQERTDPESNIDAALFLSGIQAGLRGEPATYSAEQVQRATSLYNDGMAMRQMQEQARTDPDARRRLAEAPRNAEASARFLAEVERRAGVRKTASGLLYRIARTGRGERPTLADQVVIRYIGTLADGTVFDRSPGSDTTTLPVGAVVPGFAEALLDMRPGERRTVWIPADLAYGLQGAPGPNGQGGIPSNSAIEFDLTLVRVVPMADSISM